MATATLTSDKTQVAPGDKVVFRVSVTGLTQPVVTTGAGHVDITLSDGTMVSDDSDQITITKPGQTIASVVVTFQGAILAVGADGTYTATAK